MIPSSKLNGQFLLYSSVKQRREGTAALRLLERPKETSPRSCTLGFLIQATNLGRIVQFPLLPDNNKLHRKLSFPFLGITGYDADSKDQLSIAACLMNKYNSAYL
jgi:hypothetical protein